MNSHSDPHKARPHVAAKPKILQCGSLQKILNPHVPHPNFTGPLTGNGPFWVAHTMKNLFALWEAWFQSLGQEDPPGEGHGNSRHYSCLENSVGRGSWQSIVNGVVESDMTERLTLWSTTV